ncbi:NHL repeat-containing protein 3 isoform X2 [Hemicordylus capensis]|uniref:NHL repeat-containing protein 3 isoform X2 n=1 Tax=Hemicordylus capensis TaxID=884348 RepID=UPI002303BC9E|nr:NHL repeat-containing protein 3 isoform X2 [Hemicordylus capensis]
MGVRQYYRGRLLVVSASLLLLATLYKIGLGSQVLNHLSSYASWKTEKQLYKLDVAWPKFPEQFTGQTFCVAVDHIHGLVYVGQRGNDVPKVLVFSEDGYFLQAWNTTLEMPHGIFAINTPNASSVWITDVGTGKNGHTVQQYSPSGRLLQVIGTPGKAGSGTNPIQFDQPAEIFVEENGDLYIVDGDGGMNNRLLKLTPDLQVIWLRGENGSGITQFRIPHSVTVDSVGRIYC